MSEQQLIKSIHRSCRIPKISIFYVVPSCTWCLHYYYIRNGQVSRKLETKTLGFVCLNKLLLVSHLGQTRTFQVMIAHNTNKNEPNKQRFYNETKWQQQISLLRLLHLCSSIFYAQTNNKEVIIRYFCLIKIRRECIKLLNLQKKT